MNAEIEAKKVIAENGEWGPGEEGSGDGYITAEAEAVAEWRRDLTWQDRRGERNV